MLSLFMTDLTFQIVKSKVKKLTSFIHLATLQKALLSVRSPTRNLNGILNTVSPKQSYTHFINFSFNIDIIFFRYLEWSITENSGIRKHDTATVFASVSDNPVGHDLAYRFLKTNWQRIREQYVQQLTSTCIKYY